MADSVGYAGLRFRMRAVIDGIIFRDVVQFSSSFELNTIPTAMLLVAVGRNQFDQAATIHHAVERLRVKLKTIVTLIVEYHGSSGAPDPLAADMTTPTEYTIFDGYTAGTSWERGTSEARFGINLLHWLEDLNCSSSISATSHPHNPADFSFASVFPPMGPNGGGESDPSWMMVADAAKIFITAGQMEEDLWKEILRPWLVTLASQDRIDVNPPGGMGVSKKGNDAALNALNRMTNTTGANCTQPQMGMTLHGADAEAVANSVRGALTKESFSSWVNTTLWGKLVGEWGPSYFFSVVPRISDAVVVPFVGPLQNPALRLIRSDEYNHCSQLSQLQQALQAVGIWHSAHMEGGGEARAATYPAGYKSICGWYPKDNTRLDRRGLLLIKEPPGWLTDPVAAHEFSKDTTGADRKVIGTAYVPAVGAGVKVKQPLPNKAIESIYPLMDEYAHHWYVLEKLKGRTVELSGKLRFDVSPGSNLRIEGKGDRFVDGDELALPFWGSVMQVGCVIDAEQQKAGTTFTLAHCRTDQENANPDYAIEKPPLYKAGWPGCSMSDHF